MLLDLREAIPLTTTVTIITQVSSPRQVDFIPSDRGQVPTILRMMAGVHYNAGVDRGVAQLGSAHRSGR